MPKSLISYSSCWWIWMFLVIFCLQIQASEFSLPSLQFRFGWRCRPIQFNPPLEEQNLPCDLVHSINELCCSFLFSMCLAGVTHEIVLLPQIKDFKCSKKTQVMKRGKAFRCLACKSTYLEWRMEEMPGDPTALMHRKWWIIIIIIIMTLFFTWSKRKPIYNYIIQFGKFWSPFNRAHKRMSTSFNVHNYNQILKFATILLYK